MFIMAMEGVIPVTYLLMDITQNHAGDISAAGTKVYFAHGHQ